MCAKLMQQNYDEQMVAISGLTRGLLLSLEIRSTEVANIGLLTVTGCPVDLVVYIQSLMLLYVLGFGE